VVTLSVSEISRSAYLI